MAGEHKTWRRLAAGAGGIGVLMIPWWYLWQYLPLAALPATFLMMMSGGALVGVGLLYYVIRGYDEGRLTRNQALFTGAAILAYFAAGAALTFFFPPVGVIMMAAGIGLGIAAGQSSIGSFSGEKLLHNIGVGLVVSSWLFTFIFPPVGVACFILGILLWAGTSRTTTEKSEPLPAHTASTAATAKQNTASSSSSPITQAGVDFVSQATESKAAEEVNKTSTDEKGDKDKKDKGPDQDGDTHRIFHV